MKRQIATIGFFDGVHRGHLCLISQLCALAEERNMESVIVTFDNHPRQVIQLDYAPQLLSTRGEKELRLRQTAVQRVLTLHFTAEMSRMTAAKFMLDVLRNQLGISSLVMGYDHQFGHGGGSYEQYVKWGHQCGIEILRAHEMEGEKVSSSRIRSLLYDGKLSEANALLGYCYPLTGMVEEGYGIGRRLGFPTANLHLPAEKLLPASGVYACTAVLTDGTDYPAVLNIGQRPTIHNGKEVSVEAHLIGYTGNLYHQEVRLDLKARLRDEQQFPSEKELIRQISEDSKEALRLLSI